MAIYKIFKATVPSMRFVFKDGVSGIFVNGKFMTDVDSQIAELMDEVKIKGFGKSFHSTIYVDPTEEELDSEAPTPYEVLKKEMYDQAMADIKRSMNPAQNMGSTNSNHAASVATSATIQEMTGIIAGATAEQKAEAEKTVVVAAPVDTNGDGKESTAEKLAALQVKK